MATIKILILAANPNDMGKVALDEEVRKIQRGLRDTDFGKQFEIISEWAVRGEDLQGLLMRHKPSVVHFSGHGTMSGELCLINDHTGSAIPISSDSISDLFSLLADTIQCVVLNACYSEVQAKAISKTIPCVIGMSRAVSDNAAIAFSTGFYQALGFGKSILSAFELGRNQMALVQNEIEQELPKLLTRNSINPGQLILANTKNFRKYMPIVALALLALIISITLSWKYGHMNLPEGLPQSRSSENVYAGSIVDGATGSPIFYAHILLIGTNCRAFSNADGYFSFDNCEQAVRLAFPRVNVKRSYNHKWCNDIPLLKPPSLNVIRLDQNCGADVGPAMPSPWPVSARVQGIKVRFPEKYAIESEVLVEARFMKCARQQFLGVNGILDSQRNQIDVYVSSYRGTEIHATWILSREFSRLKLFENCLLREFKSVSPAIIPGYTIIQLFDREIN